MDAALPSQWEKVLGDWARQGDVVDGKYRLDRIIGAGGMGVVVEAWHVRFDEHVALKILHPDASVNEETRLRFEREARAAFKIKSEYVARVLDVGSLPVGAPYMVMEYLDGSDLADLIAHGHHFGITEAVDHILQACAGVAEAHALGIVHRDLKPENLFLVQQRDGTPCVKVLDFGISKVTGLSGVRARALTNTSVTMGTPHYMAPEQWQSARDVSFGADLWALGVILFELLSGKPPFDAPELGELCAQVLTRDPPSLRGSRADVPEALEAAVVRCLERDTAKRFSSAAELARALVPFASSRGRSSARRIVGIREEDVPTSSDPVTHAVRPIRATPPMIGASPTGTDPAIPFGLAETAEAKTRQDTLRMHAPPPVEIEAPPTPAPSVPQREMTLPSSGFGPRKIAGLPPQKVAVIAGVGALVLLTAVFLVVALGDPTPETATSGLTPLVSVPVPEPTESREPPPPAPESSARASAKPREPEPRERTQGKTAPEPSASSKVPRKETKKDEMLDKF